MRTMLLAALSLPLALAACSSEKKVVVVQPPPAVAAPAPGSDVVVTHRVVNSLGGTIHREPDPQSPVLATLRPGDQVSVVGSAEGSAWSHVVANGVDGYMENAQLQ
ncbi:MAG TPA: SH3 domain-containing protein [Dongiaceae bacterium]|nr:SH3 domain-containing protein [Dongiaceae bacterium]